MFQSLIGILADFNSTEQALLESKREIGFNPS